MSNGIVLEFRTLDFEQFWPKFCFLCSRFFKTVSGMAVQTV